MINKKDTCWSNSPPSPQSPACPCPQLKVRLSSTSGSAPASCTASEPAGESTSPWAASPERDLRSPCWTRRLPSSPWTPPAPSGCFWEWTGATDVWVLSDWPTQGLELELLPFYLQGSRKPEMKRRLSQNEVRSSSKECCPRTGVNIHVCDLTQHESTFWFGLKALSITRWKSG